MENKTIYQGLPISDPDAVRNSFDISKYENVPKSKSIAPKSPDNIERFKNKLDSSLIPSLPAKELVSLIIRAAIETEYGSAFTLSKNFDKMVKKLADTVMVSSELRREALSVASLFIEKKMPQGKKH